MAIAIRQIHPVFVGEVSGIDLRAPSSRDEVRAIEAGMDRCAVLVFHDQNITDDQQIAFTRNFGEIENSAGGSVTRPDQKRLNPLMNDVSNLNEHNQPLDRDDRRRLFNQLWHSDSSFRAIPAKYSLLYSRGLLGFNATPEEEAMFRPVRQRLVRTHPVTGRKSLYLASHAGTIVGWPLPEARALLRDLTEHATQPQFVHVHRWRQYDLVIWDNRQTMHRVRRFDESEIRDMRRTTVAGDAPTIEQVQAA